MNFDNFELLLILNSKIIFQFSYIELDLDSADPDKEIDKSGLDLLGEGGEEGLITPGQSVVFAVLEVCLCLLVRQIPALNPNPGGATAILSQRRYLPCEKSGKLIAAALNVLETLPSLCSPSG